ncbi:MAG: penicillin-binding protein activator [Rheinheimera sp.]|nr:penicillin-binding protein activator [Rheinheimera sp.]MBM34916.1 penicillin-binding protein activator [Rheinheimera sp.]HAW94569.1 penicillin-binding protein activator [Candidatus Azambacteria bacterium]|tara:strand:+ start:62812 stop:64665 length:1854 start_codon:yes stop_codon:yes gene_type:complete
MVLCNVNSSKLKPLLFLSLCGLLASCAQQPQTTIERPADAPQQQVPATKIESAADLYQKARDYQGEARQIHLLRAARAALIQQQYPLALAITHTLANSEYSVVRQRNIVLLLQAYLANNELERASVLLDQTPLDALPTADLSEYLWHGAQFYAKQQRSLAASRWLLQLDQQQQSTTNYPELWNLLWQQLTALSPANLATLRTNATNRQQAWLNLAELSRQHIGQQDALQQALAAWHQRYPQMPGPDALPEALQQLLSLTPYQPSRIGVLLPLTGNFRAHAKALQYGLISAASAQQASTQLIFIDSQQSPEQITLRLKQQMVDFVIGPLLRDQVDLISQQADWPWPTLFLNSRDPAQPKRDNHFFYALSLEDEASQMAELFQQKNYQRPVVISARNNISQRMQQHFAGQWQAMGHPAPELYQFSAKAELETIINDLLETDISQNRIRSISSLVSSKIKLEAEPHSRLDIDAIYLLADPIQTRLFKPYVDVSVNQIAPRLPVYASSRSFSASLDSNEQRDLNGLTFTEMPWMLGEQSSVKLREQYQQLFTDQDEILQRLFAMGHDAYALIARLKQQQHLPALVFPGLTGQLSLDQNGSIVRRLSWASYRNNRLISVQEP